MGLMGFESKVERQWKPTKIHKRVKLGKFCKKLRPAKLFKVLKPLFRMLFPAAVPSQRHRHQPQPQPRTVDNLAFMTCIIEVNPRKIGWQKAVLSLLRNCKGARFKMDKSGVVEVSGIGDPNKVLKKLGRSKGVDLHWYQFGQCSNNLFMPETKKNPVQDKPNPYNTPYNSFPPYTGYGYHYPPPPPQVFRHYLPYY